jgi:(p)ppGpp synthase/HD superfamily hydrolase
LFKDINEERKIRLASRINKGNGEVDKFITWLNNFPDPAVVKIGNDSLDKVLKLKFSHNILNTSTYLAHIVRVARMSIEFCPDVAHKSITPALIHNIIETTNLSEKQFLKKFDKFSFSTVEILTINRKKQHLQTYLEDYYSNIMESHLSVGIIKIADKIDNIYTLCLNADKLKRDNYLKQIENFIIPLSVSKVPHVTGYLVELVENAHKTGHISIGDIK